MSDSPSLVSVEPRMYLLGQQVREWKKLLEQEKQTRQAIANRYQERLSQAGDDIVSKRAVMADRSFQLLPLRETNLVQRASLQRRHEQEVLELGNKLTIKCPT